MTTAAAERFRSALYQTVTPEAEAHQDTQKADDAAWLEEQRRQRKLLDEAWRNAAANAEADRIRAKHLAEIRRQDHECERAEWENKWGRHCCL